MLICKNRSGEREGGREGGRHLPLFGIHGHIAGRLLHLTLHLRTLQPDKPKQPACMGSQDSTTSRRSCRAGVEKNRTGQVWLSSSWPSRVALRSFCVPPCKGRVGAGPRKQKALLLFPFLPRSSTFAALGGPKQGRVASRAL